MSNEVGDALRSDASGASRIPEDLVSAEVQVELRGATAEAREKFRAAVQAYADSLALESETQEFSNKPSSVRFREISANSVARATEVLSRHGTRPRKRKTTVAALAGAPLFGALIGVFGSNLNSAWQWVAFGLSVFMMLMCTLYITIRRLL